jgi:transposase
MASTLHISEPVKRREYDAAFKTEALRSARAAAQQLGVSETLLYRWRRAEAEAAAGSAAQAQAPEWRALRADNQRLEREVAV